MSKPKFGDNKNTQRDQCLEIAARLKRDTKENITPGLVTRECIKEKLFSADQMSSFAFQGARRQVESWMKTADGKGLPLWGQLPLVTADGERAWDLRREMQLPGYAWNFLIRDDVVVKNMVLRDRWKEEALERWSNREFDEEVDRLREEREPGVA